MHDYKSFKSEETTVTRIGDVWPRAIIVPAGAQNDVQAAKRYIVRPPAPKEKELAIESGSAILHGQNQ